MKILSWFNISLLGLLLTCCVQISSKSSLSPVATLSSKANESTQTIYLVRHAEKVISEGKDPVLSPEGELRAQRLADLLGDVGITKIYSTDYIRTRSTAAPLAKNNKLEIVLYAPHDSLFAGELASEKAQSILVVGHSNTTPKLVNQLLKEGKYEQLDESEYDKIFKLTRYANGYTAEVLEF